MQHDGKYATRFIEQDRSLLVLGMVRAHALHIQPQSTSEATLIPVDHVLALVDIIQKQTTCLKILLHELFHIN